MRIARLAVLLLLLPALLDAQQLPKTQISAYFTPQSVTYSDSSGTMFNGGFGAALNVFWSQRFSTELSVGAEQSYYTIQALTPGGPNVEIDRLRVESYPLDLVARYHFTNGTKWLPFIGGGVRYVNAPSIDADVPADSRTSAEVTGGVIYQFSPRWGLRMDVRQLLTSSAFYDANTKGSVGLSWNF